MPAPKDESSSTFNSKYPTDEMLNKIEEHAKRIDARAFDWSDDPRPGHEAVQEAWQRAARDLRHACQMVLLARERNRLADWDKARVAWVCGEVAEDTATQLDRELLARDRECEPTRPLILTTPYDDMKMDAAGLKRPERRSSWWDMFKAFRR